VATLDLLTRAIEARTLSFSHDAAELMTRVPTPDEVTMRDFLRTLSQSDDEDHRVLASHLPFLKPGERPESPIATMVALLLTTHGGPGVFDFAEMPEDPADWSELYPSASREPFKVPSVFREIHGQRMPGLAGQDINLMLNADKLKKNGDYMGNCTFSYRNRCEAGTCVIGRLLFEGTEYNYSMNLANGQWAPGEVNSRFNAGGVPDGVREAVARLIHGVNAVLAQRPGTAAA
jgi:hypothetical protein